VNSNKLNNHFVFDRFAEESISDEQAKRLLLPVLDMIEQDKFSKRRANNRKAMSVAAVAAAALVAVALPRITTNPHAFVEIEGPSIPLASTSTVKLNSFTGRVELPFSQAPDSVFILACEYCEDTYVLPQALTGGTTELVGVAYGSYVVLAQPTPDSTADSNEPICRLIVTNEGVELIQY
jgi:hypothetical protein